jgi:hypothetical protein
MTDYIPEPALGQGQRALRPGLYRRSILIRGGDGEVHADLEDDPHRHRIRLRHDGGKVTAIEGMALRTPWQLCSGAVVMLQQLIGMKLSPRPQAVYRHAEGAQQCTHLFDLAGLAIAHAARGTSLRRYDMTVDCPGDDEVQEAVLQRDGMEVLRWKFKRPILLTPARFAGMSFKRVLALAESRGMDIDEHEAIVVLHRASFTSVARYFDLDRMRVAGDIPLKDACYVYQPGRAEVAARMVGSTQDFSASPEAVLADLRPSTD